jgi:hypothetical protein
MKSPILLPKPFGSLNTLLTGKRRQTVGNRVAEASKVWRKGIKSTHA